MSALTKASVTINVTKGIGMHMQVQYASHIKGAAKPATPNEVLIAAAEEIARIAELCGFGADVEAAVVDARKRVTEWKNGEV